MGAIVGAIATANAGSNFDNAYAVEETFANVKADGSGISLTTQAWMQVAALGCTLAISLVGGALSGFICSKIGNLDYQFDDKEHFVGVDYADAIARFSSTVQFDHQKSETMKDRA